MIESGFLPKEARVGKTMKRIMDPDRHFTLPAGGERALCQAGRSGWRPIRLEIDAPGD